MPNKRRGEVELELAGETRLLKLDFNAIADLEAAHGGTPIHALLRPERFGLGVLRDAVFFALKAGDPVGTRKLTVRQVGEWLTKEADRLQEIAAAIADAAEASMPSEKKADPTPPPAPTTPSPAAIEVVHPAHPPTVGSTTTPSSEPHSGD